MAATYPPETAADVGAEPANANIQSHIGITAGNPHGTSAADIGLGNVNNTADADKPVSTAQAAADAAILSAANSHAESLVVGLWDDRGGFDASVNAFPAAGGSGAAGAIMKGDIWTISVVAASGPLAGLAIGSTVRAATDAPGQTAGNWAIAEVGLGYVPENNANKDVSGGYAGLTQFKLNLKNALGTVTSWFTTAATQARTWTLPDKDGTVAMTSDLTGVNVSIDASGFADTSLVNNQLVAAKVGTGIISVLSLAEISVTGATTATKNRMNVCSGISENYAVPLPTMAAGDVIAFRMSSGLTKLVTIDAGVGKTIDGINRTLVMWANESITLVAVDANTCIFIKKNLIPMTFFAYSDTAQTGLTSGSLYTTALNQKLYDTGNCFNTTTYTHTPRRTNKWQYTASISMSPASGSFTRASSRIYKAGANAGTLFDILVTMETGSGTSLPGAIQLSLATSDAITLVALGRVSTGVWQINGNTGSLYSTHLAGTEVIE